MFTSREWLLIFAVAVVGALGTMVYRAMTMAFRFVAGVAGQYLSALGFWAAIGLAAVLVLRLAHRPS